MANARATLALRAQGGLPALLWTAAEVPSPAPDAWDQVPASTPAMRYIARSSGPNTRTTRELPSMTADR